jgi:coenzyme F420 hydrogenase subunit beta
LKKSPESPKTIEAVVRQGLCIFCGTCGSACPRGAISFLFEEEYQLRIDHSLCTSCSACLNVCPGLTVVRPGKKLPATEEDYYIGEYSKIFSAYSVDFQQRFAASSGGVVTRIVSNLLAEKTVDAAILTRFSRETNLKPEGYIATSVEDIIAAQGSKYSPVPLNVLLGRLDPSKKYAYVGLPCHLQGLDMYLKKFPGNRVGEFFRIGLFCSRTNTLQATKELLRLNHLNESEINSIRYRGSGHPGYFSVLLKNGEQKRIPHLDPTYWKVLFSRYFVQYRCWLCPDKTAHYADIACGDDWSQGLMQDRVGTSSVICRSPAAAEYLERMIAEGKLAAVPLRLESLVSSQGLKHKTNLYGRKRIAIFFKLPLPQYAGYEFKKEKLRQRNELAMLIRIRLQGCKALHWVMACDVFFSPKIQALGNGLNLKKTFLLFRRTVPGKLKQILNNLKKTARPVSVAPSCIPDKIPKTQPSPMTRGKYQFHIITCGGYGYQDIGDEAMPKALIANLKKGFPEGLAVTMLSPDPEYTSRYHGQPALSDIRFHSGKEDTAGLNREMERYLRWTREYIAHRKRLFLKLLILQRNEFHRVLKTISQCDALVNVGGGNINSIIRRELYKKCTLQRIAHLLGKPFFISGQTIGPFDNDNDRSIAREALELAAVLTFRDAHVSAGRVSEIGVQGPLMYSAGDDALSLPAISRTEAEKLIAADAGEEWSEIKADAIWGINLKGSLKLFKGKGRSGDLANEVSLMTRICEHILRSYSAKLLLVSTDFCPGVDDRQYLRQLCHKIDPDLRQRVAVLGNPYNDHQLKGITGCCDFVLGSRYHFLVFALSGFVPAIGIASGLYQQTKLSGVLELLGLSEYFVSRDMEYASAAEVFPFIERLVKNRENVKEKLHQTVPPLTAKSMEIVTHIRSRLLARP